MDTLVNTAAAFNCPNCGAELMFDADKGKLCCEFCESEFTNDEITASGAEEAAHLQKQQAEEYCAQMDEYSCPNCGAEIVADEVTAANICVYCHSPVVLKGKLSGQMMPDKIIPFKFGKQEAEKRFLEFAKTKWFVPNDFKTQKHAEQMQGVYYPFWVTDADTTGNLSAQATKIRKWRSGNTEYTETSKYNVERLGYIHFEDIVSCALSKGEKDMLEGILPYPSESLEPFSMPYLSGFTAKKRDIERQSLTPEVRNRMHEYAATLLRDTVNGYATVSVTGCNVRVNKSHWEYSLMPIWLLSYVTPKKTYKYAMNGYTGKIYGELPVSIKKVLLTCASVFTAVATVASVIGGIFL